MKLYVQNRGLKLIKRLTPYFVESMLAPKAVGQNVRH